MGAGRGLTTRGWAFLLGGVGAACVALGVGERDLLFVSFLVAILLALAWVTSSVRVLRTRAEVTYSLSPRRLHVDEPAVLTLQVRNTSRSTLRLDVQQESVAHLFAGDRVLLPAIAPGAQADITIEFTPRRRGAYRVHSPKVHELDPLALVSTLRTLDANLDVLVLPAVVELEGLPRGLRGRALSSGGVIAHSGHADAGVRAYRNGDDPRTVHWRASARLEDELVVRLSEPAGLERIRLIVDDRLRFTKNGDAEREAAIALAASIGHHLAGEGVEVTATDLQGRVLASGRDLQEDLLVALASLSSADTVRAPAGSRTPAGPRSPAGTQSSEADRSPGHGTRRLPPVDAVIAVLGDLSGVDSGTLGRGRLGRGIALAFLANPAGASALQNDGWRVVVLQGSPGRGAAANKARFVRAWQDGLGS